MSSVSDIGERGLIEYFMKHLTPMQDSPIPFWDDASALNLGDGKALVVNTDMLVWETDIPQGMTPFQGARKAVVMNISDLAAKGVKPLAFMASLGVPSDYPVIDAEELVKGFEVGARLYSSYVLGGDTNEACGVIISGVAMGTIESSKIMKRDNGVQPGDILAVTGNFGCTSAGFKHLIEGYDLPNALRERVLNSVYMPDARVEEGKALAETGAVTSCIDSSDGLGQCLIDLRRSSGYGFTLHTVPINETAEKFAVYNDLNPRNLALYGGEEYELVFTYNPDDHERVREALESVGCTPVVIGRVSKCSDIVLDEGGDQLAIENSGWDHFRL